MANTDVYALIQQTKALGRTLLTEVEAKALVQAAGISVVRTELARTAEEAVSIARDVGFPVALKVCSPDVAHKSDVGGVQLNLTSEDVVRDGFAAITQSVQKAQPNAILDGVSVQPMAQLGVEVIIGLTTDAQFGPLVMFGLGGVM